MPKVSIILTSFNHAEYLREAIDSVLNQIFEDYELIIWDDASADESWNIIQSYSDPRIKTFRNDVQKRGVYGINKAISEIVTGEYIAIHHSDDVWELNKLEKQVNFLDVHPEIGAVFTNTLPIGEDSRPLQDKLHFYFSIFNQENKSRHLWLRHFFEKGNALCHPSVLIRKKCYDECGLYRYGLAQAGDFDMWIRLCLKYEIYILPDKLVKFRVRDNEENASGSRPETRSRWNFEYYLLLSNFLKINRADDLFKVFPEAKKYCSDESCIRYAIAMVMLEVKPFHTTIQFALQILFDLINDQNQNNTFFSANDFVKLTGELDPLQILNFESFNQAVTERDEQIAKLNKTLTESDRQIISLNRTITNRDEQITSLGQAVAERDSQIIAIYNSRSWRITKPLRFLGTLVRKTQHILVLFRTLLYRSGSLRQTMRKILQVLLQEGWQGIRVRLEYPTNIEIKKGSINFDPQKDIVLVVSHDASRTGAPILTLSIVQRLQKKYNVISLLLGEGSITEHFSKNSSFLIEAPFARNNTLTAHSLIEQLVRQHDIQFAIVNSIESRIVLPPLARHFIPTIHLIHEFAAYTRPISAFVEALLWARETVFSTPITYKDALACHSELNNRPCHIIPQGLYDLPAVEKDNLQATTERDRIFSLLHPNGKADDSIIIIGIGSVHLRKGVDLFIECATHLAQTEFSDRLRFVWVGAGYDPINDSAYSVYLADQIRRAGIQEHMIFLGEISNPDIAYQAADIMLLSSRLDPLPGVAIEAMMHGVPLVCFESTTGIADVLIEHGLGAYCVARYLNVVDMADKVLSFVQSKMLREETGEKLRQIAREVFNMERYIDKLVRLAMLASHRTKQEQIDLSEIKKAGLERLDYFTSPEINLLAEEALRYYVRTWASNVKPRKLFPGFHPGIYAEQHGLTQPNADPLADYIRAKRPAGAWKYELLTEEAPRRVLPTGTRVALHLHVYYPDLLPDILAELKGNHIKPDLFISVPNDNVCSEVQVLLSQEYPTWKVNLQIVPNRGRDLGPLLTTFSSTFTQDYDLVGHLHTKKTVDVTDANMSRRWFCFLLKNLLGGKYAMADKILAHFASDPSIGMVFPDDPNIVGWSLNRPYAEKIGRRLCLLPLPQHFLFPIGTMFWARVEALKPLFDLNLTWDDYPVEPLPYDGSFLHALERILPFVVAHQGFRCVLTNIKGITR